MVSWKQRKRHFQQKIINYTGVHERTLGEIFERVKAMSLISSCQNLMGSMCSLSWKSPEAT